MTEIKQPIIINAKDKILGRLATEVAVLLCGKNKSDYCPNKVGGGKVTITNAAHIKITGNKASTKEYFRHSGWPGGLKRQTYKDLIKTKPEMIIHHAVKGMLPKNKLQKLWLKNLFIHPGELNEK